MKKFVLIIAFVLVFGNSLSAPAVAVASYEGPQISDVEAQIAELQAQVAALKTQQKSQKSSASGSSSRASSKSSSQNASYALVDVNKDLATDAKDLKVIFDMWGMCKTSTECSADLNTDGQVDMRDLQIFAQNWPR